MRTASPSRHIRARTFTDASACSRATEVRGATHQVSNCRGLSRSSRSDETNPISKTNPIEPTQNRVSDSPKRFSIDSSARRLRNEPNAQKKCISGDAEFAVLLGNSQILLQSAGPKRGQLRVNWGSVGGKMLDFPTFGGRSEGTA